MYAPRTYFFRLEEAEVTKGGKKGQNWHFYKPGISTRARLPDFEVTISSTILQLPVTLHLPFAKVLILMGQLYINVT